MTESIKEVWKDIAGYEDRYEVSNFGRVKSLPNQRRKTEIILKQRPLSRKTKGGKVSAMYVRLTDTCDAGKWRQKFRYVHHLVANEFIGKRPERLEVRHIDGDATNNKVDNLEYGTHMENMNDKRLHGTHNIGEQNPSAVLSETQVMEIKRRLIGRKRGDVAKLSRELGINYRTVMGVVNGSNWGHL